MDVRRSLLRSLPLVAVAALLDPPVAARASCGGPPPLVVVGAAPGLVHVLPGARTEVVGTGLAEGCDDSTRVVSGGGCSAPREVHERVVPRTGVRLVLVRSGRRTVLGTGDAQGAAHEVRWSVVVPPGARPGPAVLEAGGARLSVVVGKAGTPR